MGCLCAWNFIPFCALIPMVAVDIFVYKLKFKLPGGIMCLYSMRA